MSKILLPYITWRDGRPRFTPSARERELGFDPQDLRHGIAGAWYTLDEARAFSTAKYAEIVAARTSGKRIARPAPTRTVEDLLEDWHRSPHVQGLEPVTIKGYRTCINAVLYRPEAPAQRHAREKLERAERMGGAKARAREREEFSLTPVSAIEKPEVNAFVEHLIKARGRHTGRAVRAALVEAWKFGSLSTAWRLKANPAEGLRFAKPTGRIVIFTDAELRALIATADAMGRASIGDSILLGIFTGQRQGDRLALEDHGLSEGRRIFRQNKTDALVAIMETPRLAERLGEARARVAAIKLRLGTRPTTIVVDEATGSTYNADTYRHIFDDVRSECALKHAGIADKRDQDLRDTAVTWLARSSATIPEIAAITGHSLKTIYQILQHYLAITPELGDAGIRKLMNWMDMQGMAI